MEISSNFPHRQKGSEEMEFGLDKCPKEEEEEEGTWKWRNPVYWTPFSKKYNDHYNYSDDDDVDSCFMQKLQNWIKAMSSSFGSVDIEPANDQFVYITNLYASRSQIFSSYEEVITSGSGGSPTDRNKKEESRISAMEFDMQVFRSVAATGEAYLSTDTRSTSQVPNLNCEEKKRISSSTDAEEVDTDVELFIAKFYHGMKLERQKSIVEYPKMLEQGARYHFWR